MSATPTIGVLGPREIPPELEEGLTPEQRRSARRCLWVLGLLSTGSLLGASSSLYLVNHAPLALIALSPIGRHLILVAPTVHPVAFVAVATARRLVFYLASFRLGRALGPGALVWLENRAERTGRFFRWLEGVFRRFSHAVPVLIPGPGVSTIAGISGMSERVFALLAATGLVIRMLLVIVLGEWLREPIETILAFIDEYWVEGTGLIVAGVLSYRLWRRRMLRRVLEAA